MASPSSDPLECAFRKALDPGRLISDWAHSGFLHSLEGVRREIAVVARRGEPARAAAVLEDFVDGCQRKANEVDTSEGTLGDFMGDLICDWVRARSAMKADHEDTACRVLQWMDMDEHGFLEGFETQVVRAFNAGGLKAFEGATLEAAGGASPDSPLQQRWVAIKKFTFLRRGDAAGFAAFGEVHGPLTPDDCEAMAAVLLRRKNPEAALEWADHGLHRARSKSGEVFEGGLTRIRQRALLSLGRKEEATSEAWGEFLSFPTAYCFWRFLEVVPRNEHPAWKARAMEVMDRGDSIQIALLLLDLRETERLAEVVERTNLAELITWSFSVLDPVARRLARLHPGPAARAQAAIAWEMIRLGRDGHLLALIPLRKARLLYRRSGWMKEWEAIVAEVRDSHPRKSRFRDGFEDMVAGRREDPELKDIRARRSLWGQGARL